MGRQLGKLIGIAQHSRGLDDYKRGFVVRGCNQLGILGPHRNSWAPRVHERGRRTIMWRHGYVEIDASNRSPAGMSWFCCR
jgi:hypothetical protein